MVRAVRFFALSLLLLSTASSLVAQKHRPSVAIPADYMAMIQRASENEIRALEDPVPYQFMERLNWTWGSETRAVIETAEGRADRIVRFSDEPLQPDQHEKQQHRLEKLLRDRDAVKNELQDQKSETQRRIKMVKAFPKAVLFEYSGRENGLIRFSFSPNPEFSAKDRETQLYRGMEGHVWIQPVQERIVRVEGKLVKDVSFGWGVLGHLNKGGIYEIGQTEVAPGVWRISTLNVDVKGRIFLISGFRFFRQEQNTRFHVTPNTVGYHGAVESLLASDFPVPQKDVGRSASGATRSNSGRPKSR